MALPNPMSLYNQGEEDDIQARHGYSNAGASNASSFGVPVFPVGTRAGGPYAGDCGWDIGNAGFYMHNGAAWVRIGPFAGAAGLWEVAGGGTRLIIGDDVIPNGNLVRDLGLAGTRWRDLYCRDIYPNDILDADVGEFNQIQITNGAGGALRGLISSVGNDFYLNGWVADVYLIANTDVMVGDFAGDDTYISAFDNIYIRTDSGNIVIDTGLLNAGNVGISSNDFVFIDADSDILASAADDVWITAVSGKIRLQADDGVELTDDETIWCLSNNMILDPSSAAGNGDVDPGAHCDDDLGENGRAWDWIECDTSQENNCDVAEMQWVIRDIEIDITKTANADDNINLSFSTGGNHYTELIDVSDLTFVGTSLGSTAWEFDLYGMTDSSVTVAERITAQITSVSVRCRMSRQLLGGILITDAEGRATLKTYGRRYYGTEVILNSSFTNYDFDFTTNPYTGETWTWDEVDALTIGVEMRSGQDAGGIRRAECSTLTVTVNYTQGLPAGTIVEMSTLVPTDLADLRAEALLESQRLDAIKPAKVRIRPSHKHIGLTSAWQKSSVPSGTACPSIISTNPGTLMGMNVYTSKAGQEGNMQPIVLSGTAQNVYVTGAYSIGDKLVSNGDGTAVVDNLCAFDELIGYAKEGGANARIEVWVR